MTGIHEFTTAKSAIVPGIVLPPPSMYGNAAAHPFQFLAFMSLDRHPGVQTETGYFAYGVTEQFFGITGRLCLLG